MSSFVCRLSVFRTSDFCDPFFRGDARSRRRKFLRIRDQRHKLGGVGCFFKDDWVVDHSFYHKCLFSWKMNLPHTSKTGHKHPNILKRPKTGCQDMRDVGISICSLVGLGLGDVGTSKIPTWARRVAEIQIGPEISRTAVHRPTKVCGIDRSPPVYIPQNFFCRPFDPFFRWKKVKTSRITTARTK